jgi:hypothetical protein
MSKKKSSSQEEYLGKKIYGKIKKAGYNQKTVKQRIEALFLDNIGKVITRDQIIKVATDPKTKKEPENWHQRLSELRTDEGYTILSWRNRGWLRVEEYLMPSASKRVAAAKRVKPNNDTWEAVLKRANYQCEWTEGNVVCGLREGNVDPVSGGKVKLTPDHNNPHSLNPDADPKDVKQWRALCGRHQVMKKNYWDSNTGKLNIYAIIQAATRVEKEIAFKFLLDFFGYVLDDNGNVSRVPNL